MKSPSARSFELSRRIVTHAGSAHADEVVSIALLLAADETIDAIARVNEVPPADLADPSVYVLDIGRRHDPDRMNFDHHQFSADAPPRCTLSLVLDHLGLDPAAHRCWPWLETFEYWDTGGPGAAGRLLNWPQLETIAPCLASPLENALLDTFAGHHQFRPGDPVFVLLKMVGKALLAELFEIPRLVQWFADHAITVAEPQATGLLFTEWPDAPRFLTRKALNLYLRESASGVDLTITPDDRSSGFVLQRRSDANQPDFRILSGDPVISFIHASGFMAVTKSRDVKEVERLVKNLLERAGAIPAKNNQVM